MMVRLYTLGYMNACIAIIYIVSMHSDIYIMTTVENNSSSYTKCHAAWIFLTRLER